MKKVIPILFLLLTTILVKAEEVEIDGIWYYLTTEPQSAELIMPPPHNWYEGDITIPEKVTYNEIDYKVTVIGNEAFYGCSALTSITIPNTIVKIKSDAFAGCKSLTSVTIPNSVTSIGSNAFEDCSALSNVTISNTVTTIRDNTFSKCEKLTHITIPNSVTSIGSEAFSDCFALTNVIIPNSVKNIGESAFYGCSNLTNINIPNSVTHIGERAFASCPSLNQIIVEKDNPTYDSRNQCNAIIDTETNVLILGCQNTIIPNSVAIIGSNAFEGCSSLMNMTTPNSVISIEEYAFLNCSSLASITISNSVESIGEGAFFNCMSLINVYCYAETIPSTKSSVFDGLFSNYIINATLHVTAGSIDKYKATEPWSGFGSIVALTDEEMQNVDAEQMSSIFVYSHDGIITIQGAKPGITITVFSTNGTKAASGTAEPNAALTLHTGLSMGEVTIVKVGNKSIKMTLR